LFRNNSDNSLCFPHNGQTFTMLRGHHQGEEVRVRADAEAYMALYDKQAVRLHAYCWTLVGDQAASTVRDVFTAAAHPSPAGRDSRRREATMPGRLWLYRQARAECLRRGPVTVIAGRDPLLRGAARLRADQREILVLAADLPPAGVARVLSMPADRAIQLVTAARARLEQAVLKVLLADPATATHEDVIAAFERGALGALLARRAPAPPPGLRAAVIGTMTRHQHTPLVVISPAAKAATQGDAPKGRPAGRHARAAAPVIGAAAACAAAVIGAIAAGTTLNFDASPAGGDGHGALAPSTAEHGRSAGSTAAPGAGETPIVSPTDSAAPRTVERAPGDAPSPSSSSTAPAPDGGDTAGGSPSQVPETPAPTGSSPTAPPPSSPSDPSSPADPSDSTPPDSESPSDDPSQSPPGGLLPLIPRLLGDTVSTVTSGG
jgi:hypothetical protein